MSYMPQSKSDTHLTPDRVYEIIDDKWGWDAMYDPCPANTPYKSPCFFNGLYGHWMRRNFVNPPYSKGKILAFVEKAIDECLRKDNHTILLLPCKTDQKWFHILSPWYSNIKWIRGRLKFKGNQWSATQPHFLVMIQ